MKTVLLLAGEEQDRLTLEEAGFKVLTVVEEIYSSDNVLKHRFILKECDVVVVNLNRDSLPLGEGLLLQLSYNNSTPVFGYGVKLESQFLSTVLDKRFPDLDDLIRGLKEGGE